MRHLADLYGSSTISILIRTFIVTSFFRSSTESRNTFATTIWCLHACWTCLMLSDVSHGQVTNARYGRQNIELI